MARLLIIDEEPAMLDMLSRMGRTAGCEVHYCSNVAEGIEALRTRPPDLLLVDCHIGPDSGMTVLEICQRELPSLPTVMITAERNVEVVIQALRLGVRDFLLKPVTLDELVTTLQRCLRQPQKLPYPALGAPPETASGTDLSVGTTLDAFIRAQEQRFVQASLEQNAGSREKTATMLGVSLATLYRKIGPSQGRRQRT
jgi:DNA-binding NtrC family response regulator